MVCIIGVICIIRVALVSVQIISSADIDCVQVDAGRAVVGKVLVEIHVLASVEDVDPRRKAAGLVFLGLVIDRAVKLPAPQYLVILDVHLRNGGFQCLNLGFFVVIHFFDLRKRGAPGGADRQRG